MDTTTQSVTMFPPVKNYLFREKYSRWKTNSLWNLCFHESPAAAIIGSSSSSSRVFV